MSKDKNVFVVEAGVSHVPLREFVLFLLIPTHCQTQIWALIQKREQDWMRCSCLFIYLPELLIAMSVDEVFCHFAHSQVE